MIIDYDRNPNLNTEQKLQSLIESVQMALNEWSAEKKSLDETDAKLAAAIAEINEAIDSLDAQIDSINAEIDEQQEYFWHDSSGTHMANADKTAGVIVNSSNLTQVKKCSDIELNIESNEAIYTALQNMGWL